MKALVGTMHADAQFAVEVAGQKLTATAPNTGAWDKFETVTLGQIKIHRAGELAVIAGPATRRTWKAINLVRLEFWRRN